MKQTILAKTEEAFEKEYQRIKLIFIAVLSFAAIYSLLTVILYNHELYYFTLFSNIIVDFICISLAFYIYDDKILIRSRKLKIFERRRRGSKVEGDVVSISEYTQRNFSLDCYVVDIKTDKGIRKVFAEKDSIFLELNKRYMLITVDGIVVEANND